MIYLGGSMDPEAAFLLIRGMKTLEVRMKRQCATALIVAKFLEKHPKVARVHFPGLASHPDHKLAKKQMKGFGAMMAFDMKGGLAAASCWPQVWAVSNHSSCSRRIRRTIACRKKSCSQPGSHLARSAPRSAWKPPKISSRICVRR